MIIKPPSLPKIFLFFSFFCSSLGFVGCTPRARILDSGGFRVVYGDKSWEVGKGQYVIYCTDVGGSPNCGAVEEKDARP